MQIDTNNAFLDAKVFLIGGQFYIMDPMDLEIFNVGDRNDIQSLYKELIQPKRNRLKKESHYTFDKSDKKINVVSLDISHGCNLDCNYCYLSAGKKRKEFMTKDFFLSILNFLKDDKDHDIIFYFAGEGEPTINYKLLSQIPQICRTNGFTKCHFEITTNGTLISERLLNLWEKEKFSVSFSLDGDESNNINRVFSDGTSSFSTVFNNVIEIKRRSINFACKATLTPENHNILQIFRFFEDNRIDFYHGFVRRSFDNHYVPKLRDVNNSLTFQFKLVTDYYVDKIKKNQIIYARKIVEDITRIKNRIISFTGCSAGIGSFYINMYGDIYICSSHNSCKSLSVGNIQNGIDYEKMERLNYYPKDVDCYKICRKCWLRHLCSGDCIAAKWIESHDTTIPSPYQCALNEVYWKSIVNIYIQTHDFLNNNVNFSR